VNEQHCIHKKNTLRHALICISEICDLELENRLPALPEAAKRAAILLITQLPRNFDQRQRRRKECATVRVSWQMSAKQRTLQKQRCTVIYSFRSRKRSFRCAAALVEFAIIAPIFFTMVLAIIEFGRMIMVQEILVNAAREGARAATLPGATDPPTDTTVSTYLTSAGITGETVTLSPTLASNPASGTAMTMTVSVPCSSVSWLNTTAPFFSGRSISASVVMIKQ
jgi:hypothetical protein